MAKNYLVGLVGEGIEHSLTPDLHMREAQHLGIDYEYRIIDVVEDSLSAKSIEWILAEAKSAGALDGFGAMVLSNRVASLSLAQAGCERIAVTPLPYVYSLLVFRTSWLFVLLLPLALIEPAGWLTPLFTGIVAYTFFGLAEVTEELAHSVGPTANALPLAAICRAAEISLAPHLDESAPEALLPQGFRLD